ncbi:MAG: hypothetical protein ACRELY_21535 [Polyangiaceae bacterium]
MKLDAKAVAALAGFVALSFIPRAAHADDEGSWVDRKQTLPPLVIAVDGGLGIAHWSAGNIGGTGFGLNGEGSIGIIPHFTAGARVIGINFSDDAKFSNAAGYASTFDMQNAFPFFFSGADTFSNPELWARYEFLDMPNVEVSGEGRIYVPFASDSRFVVMAGLPVAIHLPQTLRVDTGAYFALGGYAGTLVYFHAPANVWFNVTEKLFLGPMTGISFFSIANGPGAGGNNSQTLLNLGFGGGYTVLPELDIKVVPIFWPGINVDNGVGNFGFSAGIEYRIDALANR